MRRFNWLVLVSLIPFPYGCRTATGTNYDFPALKVWFTSGALTDGGYGCFDQGTDKWACEFCAERFETKVVSIKAPALSVEEMFRLFETAIDRARRSKERGEYELTVELHQGKWKKVARVRTSYWQIDAIFGENPPLAELQQAIVRAAGVPKEYWYQDLPADMDQGEWQKIGGEAGSPRGLLPAAPTDPYVRD